MGGGAPGGGRGINQLSVLRDWEDAGAAWRVLTLTPERAVVALCACTGEAVDRLESADPGLIAYLRERPASDADPPA